VAPDWAYALIRGCYGIRQWASIVAVLGFARRHVTQSGPVLSYLTQGIFPFYIVHQTIIVVGEYWLKPMGLPAVDEGLILIAATAAGCLAAYEIVRRVWWLRPLFGLKAAPVRARTARAPMSVQG
jgi:glucan biosynthesis protein C